MVDEQASVEGFLHNALDAVLTADKFFIILGDGDNDAMTYHTIGIPTEDVISLIEQTLWKIDKEVQ